VGSLGFNPSRYNEALSEDETLRELMFTVEKAPNGGLCAHAAGESIFTQADDIDQLTEMVRDAVCCHWPDPADRPRTIRLRSVHDEDIAP